MISLHFLEKSGQLNYTIVLMLTMILTMFVFLLTILITYRSLFPWNVRFTAWKKQQIIPNLSYKILNTKLLKKAFYFTYKCRIVLKILKFWSCRKWDWSERLISKFITSQPGSKQLKYKCCLISQEVKAIKPWSLVSQ